VAPAELKTLSRLLDEALALAPSERNRWLANLSGPDAIYGNTLEQLLAEADTQDDSFLGDGFLGRADLLWLTYADVLRIRRLLMLWGAKNPTVARAMFERARELTESRP